MKAYLKWTLIILQALCATAHLPADSFDDGVEAYHESEYDSAIYAFEETLKMGESAAIRHNLALSYYQVGQKAEAAWQLERAIQLKPFDESYLFKMGALRQQLGLYDLPTSWWESATRALTQKWWILILTFSLWVLIAYYLIPKFGGFNRPIGLKLFAAASGVCLILSACALSILYLKRTTGIIISEEPATVRHAPASAAPETGIARSGERARVIDAHGDFLRIETEADITGWISKDAFRAL